jgi:DNA-binding PadR family transcriptional regulator
MVKIETPEITIPLRWATLLVLVNGDLSASQIAEAIYIGSGGVMQPSSCTLYPYFASFIEAGWLTAKWPLGRPSEAGRRKIIYSITDAGLCAIQAHQQLHEDLANWESIVEQRSVAS